VRDLRTGEEYDDSFDRVQTCVTVPVGDCTLAI
jgi:stearoyl-CoA 9-desaturase NADPH oxidoreductase